MGQQEKQDIIPPGFHWWKQNGAAEPVMAYVFYEGETAYVQQISRSNPEELTKVGGFYERILPPAKFETEEYTCDRSGASRYIMRLKTKTGPWAVVLLDERFGMIAIKTPEKGYLAFWPKHGSKTFRHFLVGVDAGYLGRNLSKPDQFDYKETVQCISRLADESAEDDLSLSEYEAIQRELAELKYDWSDNHITFGIKILNDYPKIGSLFGYDMSSLPFVHTYEESLSIFLSDIWPAFQEILKKEIQFKQSLEEERKTWGDV